MSRLPRPRIPLETRCLAAMRQQEWPPELIALATGTVKTAKRERSLGKLLALWLGKIAEQHGCEVSDLHLDHDPALENRKKVYRAGAHVDYSPRANDPEHLFYRPYGPQFDRSHKIKTLVRGDHGQHSDAALARKNKRIARKRSQSTGFPKRPSQVKRSAKIRSANRWPPRGSRKIQNRK